MELEEIEKTINYKDLLDNFIDLFDGFIYLNEDFQIVESEFNQSNINAYLNNLKMQQESFFTILDDFSTEKNNKNLRSILKQHKTQVLEVDLEIENIINSYEIFTIFNDANRILLLFRDVSYKYKIIKEKQQHILKNFMDLIPYAIEIRDPQGYFIAGNRAFREMWGAYPSADHNILLDHHKEHEKQALMDALNGKIGRVGESYYNPHMADPNAPDKYHWVNVICFPIYEANGQIESAACMYEDITERKEAQLKVEELKQQLEDRVRERTIKLENSEKKYRKAYNRANCFKGLFNHDISNIFNRISNAIELSHELLLKGSNTNQIFRNFELIDQQLKRGKKLVYNIRNLSEIEESEMPIIPIDVFENLKNAIEFVRFNFPSRSINISVKSFQKDIKVFANELLLDVFENILINAVDYNNNERVEIQIDINRENGIETYFVRFEFRDNGIGIKDERKKKIFTEGMNRNRDSKGLGLGLSLVSKFLELCEGKIWVENRIFDDHTKGSNFIILIKEA
ncbi:MAG: PAS domain S-box protein [Candidatus Lokiarchaeota archaeon]|nr:PAS domain S-box protein [Candidatus Lokiarchaeota archaeon]